MSSQYLGLARRKKRVVRRRQAGRGPIGATLGGLLGGMMGFARRRAAPRKRRMRGSGWFSDTWSKIKAPLGSAARAVASVFKDSAALHAGKLAGQIDPRLGRLAQRGVYEAGKTYGFARRRRVVRKRGGAFDAEKAKNMISVIRLLKGGLPGPLSGAARRKRRPVRRMAGRAYNQLMF